MSESMYSQMLSSAGSALGNFFLNYQELGGGVMLFLIGVVFGYVPTRITKVLGIFCLVFGIIVILIAIGVLK